jgi:flagellin-like protein
LGRSDADDAIRSALVAIAVSAAAVFILWTIVAVVDGRAEFSPRALRLANTAGLVVVAVGVVVGVLAVSRVDIGASWRHFKGGYPEESGRSHFSIGLGSNRYDFWRVAVEELRDHPLHGVGADNFAEDYIRERRSTEEPLYPHSLALRLPAQSGIVGTLLFIGFVFSAGLAVTRGSAFADGAARAGAAAAVYYAIHGSGDWLWEFAGLGAPAFAWLGLAGSRPVIATGRRIRPLRAGLALAALIAGLSFVFPWLAELEARRAIGSWRSDPAGAVSDLGRSRDLNPLSSRADLLEGAIASRTNDLPRMAAAFQRAIDRNDRDWYAHFELALADAGLRRWQVALTELARAARLNPREQTIRLVRSDVAAKRPIDRDQIDRLFVERVRTRVGS